jgi:hypothetical protein
LEKSGWRCTRLFAAAHGETHDWEPGPERYSDAWKKNGFSRGSSKWSRLVAFSEMNPGWPFVASSGEKRKQKYPSVDEEID